MGAWGTGPFENDMAMDWLAELEADGVQAVEMALDEFKAAKQGGYIDADVGSMIIAAGESVAAAHGQGAEDLPDEAEAAITAAADAIQAAPGLAGKLLDALEAVFAEEGSELYELWHEEEGEDAAGFDAAGDDLKNRLQEVRS